MSCNTARSLPTFTRVAAPFKRVYNYKSPGRHQLLVIARRYSRFPRICVSTRVRYRGTPKEIWSPGAAIFGSLFLPETNQCSPSTMPALFQGCGLNERTGVRAHASVDQLEKDLRPRNGNARCAQGKRLPSRRANIRQGSSDVERQGISGMARRSRY